MQAKITDLKGYRCAPDGAVVVCYSCGDIVRGDVAIWAIADGAAEAFSPVAETKVVSPPERKRGRGK